VRLRPLPASAKKLLESLNAPPALVAHLTLTHDVAAAIVQRLDKKWPGLTFDREAVRLGAAIHDVGKVRCPLELTAPGDKHEGEGEKLLLSLGWPQAHARFCRTHGQWNEESPLEDLLVALANTIWNGERDARLEDATAVHLARQLREEPWQVYLALDDLLTDLTVDTDARLEWSTGHRF
jgi:hypothetical protein